MSDRLKVMGALAFILVMFGLVGRLDYSTALETENETLKAKLATATAQIAISGVRCARMAVMP